MAEMLGDLLALLYQETVGTVLDLAPILGLIAVLQLGVVRRPIPHLSRILVGLVYVAIGLTLFRIGISERLVPIGRDMAQQLVSTAFSSGSATLWNYLPILSFAALIGFTATLIEPTLIAAADRVDELSGGSLRAIVLRMVIASGFALGLLLGTFRILYGVPLAYLIAAVSAVLIVLAMTSPRGVVPLALDSGGIATSVVTVPLIAAYGVAVAEAMPTEVTAVDGFGLIALALLLSAVLLLTFAQIEARMVRAARMRTGDRDAV